MKVVIVDAGIGNISSIQNMLKRIGVEAIHSANPEDIMTADKLILPGVGAFDHGMNSLVKSGLIEPLHKAVFKRSKPILGICLGMQLLLDRSDEGSSIGLGWIKGRCLKFNFTSVTPAMKVPHMGWNVVKSTQPNNFINDSEEFEVRFYFVHSYHAHCDNPSDVIATSHYGYDFPAMIGRDHIWGVQFHPEKSHKYGMRLLKNFIECKA